MLNKDSSSLMKESITLYIVDDHKVFRDGIESLLKYEEDIEVLGSAGSVQEFYAKVNAFNPNVILMDISIGKECGINATKWIKEQNPAAKVLILSMHNEEKYVKKVLEAGANGYLLKDVGTEEMLRAIRTVAEGNTFYSQSISTIIVEKLLNKDHSKKTLSGQKLTPRELEVLKLIVDEKSNKEIANHLFISIRTVDSHRRNLLEKLNLKNTAGLVKYAIQNGIVKL